MTTFTLFETAFIIAASLGLAHLLNRRRWFYATEYNKQLDARVNDLTERVEGIAERVDIDPLTGVFTRVAGERRMREALRAFPSCLIFWLDCDDFGLVNKKHGWPEGDRLLCDLADKLKARFGRAHDTIFRYGLKADEFGIVLPVITDPDSTIVDPLYRMSEWAVGALRDVNEESLLKFSFGGASTRDVDKRGDVLAEAQELCRSAKEQRKMLARAAADAEVETTGEAVSP